jgi:hypothetical protein
LAVADLETLRHRVQEQAQLNSDEFDDDELSEQELELVAGGKLGGFLGIIGACGFWRPPRINP